MHDILKQNLTAIIGVIGIFIAWIAYRHHALARYVAIKNLLSVLLHELRLYEDWFSNSYMHDYLSKRFYDFQRPPLRVDFPALREIITGGHLASIRRDMRIKVNELSRDLAVFDERTQAFNQYVDALMTFPVQDTLIAERSNVLLQQCGIGDPNVDIVEFRNRLHVQLNSPELDENIRDRIRGFLNQVFEQYKILHVDLIGTYQNPAELHSLWMRICCRIEFLSFPNIRLFPFTYHWILTWIVFPLILISLFACSV